MIRTEENLRDEWIGLFFEEINKTGMKRSDFDAFKKAYQSRDVVISLWDDERLVGFGSMLTDWTMNSIIYDVVVLESYRNKGFGKKVMEELMARAPRTRFYLTSTFGHEDFYKKMGYRKHKTAFALYPTDSPYLE